MVTTTERQATAEIPVDTVDGRRIGRLVEIRGPFMRVARGRLRGDGWLPREYVLSASQDRLVMEFRKAALRSYWRSDLPAFPESRAVPSGRAA